jgi:hypothetical protein
MGSADASEVHAHMSGMTGKLLNYCSFVFVLWRKVSRMAAVAGNGDNENTHNVQGFNLVLAKTG